MTTSNAAANAAAPALPASLPVRRLTPADLPACLDLAADRGWTREEHKWRLLLTAGQGFGIDAPPGDGRGGLIATAVVTTYADARRPISNLSMMLVAARHARRGIGLRLLRHAMAECGTDVVFLAATEEGRPLYERAGFEPVGTLTMLRGPFAGTAPGSAAGRVRPATTADLPAVIAYDAPVFGADRTGLLARLPSFADQFLVARAAPDGPLTGFAAAWPDTGRTVLGPVVADDLPTAQALVARLAAGAPAALPLRFGVNARHPELANWLRAGGMSADSRVTWMIHGAPDLPGDASRRFASYSALG